MSDSKKYYWLKLQKTFLVIKNEENEANSRR